MWVYNDDSLQGDIGQEMYFIHKGVIEVVSESGEEVKLKQKLPHALMRIPHRYLL